MTAPRSKPPKGEDVPGFEDFEGDAKKALVKAVTDKLNTIDLDDLEAMDEVVLAETDHASRHRLVYVCSLLRLLGFLRTSPPTWDHAEKQARLGLGYIKHAEAQGLKALQLGRATSDKAIAAEVASLRQELAQIAHAKAKYTLIAEKTNGEKDEGAESAGPPA